MGNCDSRYELDCTETLHSLSVICIVYTWLFDEGSPTIRVFTGSGFFAGSPGGMGGLSLYPAIRGC